MSRIFDHDLVKKLNYVDLQNMKVVKCISLFHVMENHLVVGLPSYKNTV